MQCCFVECLGDQDLSTLGYYDREHEGWQNAQEKTVESVLFTLLYESKMLVMVLAN